MAQYTTIIFCILFISGVIVAKPLLENNDFAMTPARFFDLASGSFQNVRIQIDEKNCVGIGNFDGVILK